MPVVGMAEVDVEYKGHKQCMSLLVVPGNGPSLLGCNWLRHIQLDWREVNRISTRLVLKCGLAHLNANANARDESNANANASAQHLNQMQMQVQMRSS